MAAAPDVTWRKAAGQPHRAAFAGDTYLGHAVGSGPYLLILPDARTVLGTATTLDEAAVAFTRQTASSATDDDPAE